MRRTLASLLFITTIALALPATAAPARQSNAKRTQIVRNQDDGGFLPRVFATVRHLAIKLQDDIYKGPSS
jgi:hypothetical protein